MVLHPSSRPMHAPKPAPALAPNKSGETSDTANDAAVVYGPTADYILVVLSHGWTSENAANENVVKVSQLVYSFFEG